MDLVDQKVTKSGVWMRFADNSDPKKAKESIELQVPISALKTRASEGVLDRIDRFFGLAPEPSLENISEDKHTLTEIKKAALEYAQEILKKKSS